MQTPQSPSEAAAARHMKLRNDGGNRHPVSRPIGRGVLRRTIVLASTVTLGALVFSGQAGAQTQQLLVVDAHVPAHPAKTDVEAACPALVDVLQRELALAVSQQGKSGTANVQFDWQGGAVRDVVVRGGPGEYRQPIRRALQNITCVPGPGGDRITFAIRFDPEADLDAERVQPPRVAQRLAQRQAP